MPGDSSRASTEIDRLYQLPLAEFTAARNELAKREAKATAAVEIRALQKPSLPAWAVNQLFWKKRKVFDRLIDAARRARVEHGRQLSGKSAEVGAAEQRHRDALKAATDEIRGLLKSAGEQETNATLLAVTETLHALPGREDHGRLVKPLKPLGFEALAGLVGPGGASFKKIAKLAAPKRELPTTAKEVASAEKALRRALVEERAAKAEVARAEMALARLQRERKELQERVDQITSRRDQASVDFDERRRALDRATADRERLAGLLAALKK